MLGNDDDIGEAQHRAYLTRGIHSHKIINDADGGDVTDMRGTAITKSCGFGKKEVEVEGKRPVAGLLNVADEEVVGAEVSGKPKEKGDVTFVKEGTFAGVKAIEFDDAHAQLLEMQDVNQS
jgi:hypothetical protein